MAVSSLIFVGFVLNFWVLLCPRVGPWFAVQISWCHRQIVLLGGAINYFDVNHEFTNLY